MADKYADAKCFVVSESGYQELTHSELCRRQEKDESYKNKKFLPLHGMLMEVAPEEYQEFYKTRRRQKYLRERSTQNGDISIDMLTTDEFNGEDILSDRSDGVAEQVIHRIMLDKLKKAILLLSDEEQLLIYRRYYSEVPEKELAKLYGISQQAISKRLLKIREKMKNLLGG